MTPEQLQQLLAGEEHCSSEKLDIALQHLEVIQPNNTGLELVDSRLVSISAFYLMSLKEVTEEWGKLLTALNSLIQKSICGLSADLLQDELEYDFNDKDPDFKIDYSGGYTWVPDTLLPVFLQEERRYFRPLVNFYFHNLFRLAGRRHKLEEAVLPKLNIQSAEFKNLYLAESQLYGSQFKDCVFDHVSLAMVEMVECSFVNCHFKSCALGRANLSGAQFENCTFEKGGGLATIYKQAKLINCQFNEVLLGLSDFSDTQIDNVKMSHCYIAGSTFPLNYLTQSIIDCNYAERSFVLTEGLQYPDFWPKKCSIPTWNEWLETGRTTESTANLDYD